MEERPFKIFTCTYEYQGATWCFHLKAPNLKDAEARLVAIRNAIVDYELEDSIPWHPGKQVDIVSLSDSEAQHEGNQT